MDKIKVQIVHSKVLQALFAGSEGAVVAALGVPQFAGYEQLFAGLSALPDSFSHRAFISIDGGGVDVGITCEDCLADSIHANIPVRGLESAESGAGDEASVIQYHFHNQ